VIAVFSDRVPATAVLKTPAVLKTLAVLKTRG
jgi:hypothetical protein